MEVPAELLQGVVGYVAGTHPKILKIAETERKLAAAAGSLVDKLIKAGMVDGAKRQAAVNSVVNDPLAVANALDRAADQLLQVKQAAAAVPVPLGKGVRHAGGGGGSGDEPSEKPLAESDRLFLERFNWSAGR
jgi:hypothetical protein